MSNFTHIHVHSSFSLMDGFSHPNLLAARAKELGMTALAITDHNHLLGIPEFQNACKENDIKPILGYEAYYTEDSSILSKSSDERLEWAMEQARKYGPEKGFDFDSAYYDLRFPWDKKGTKRRKEQKVTKKQLDELLQDYYYDTAKYHLILLAKNQTGWKNLVKIQSESAKICTYSGRYFCDLNLLKKYSDGIICSTACIGSYFAQKFIEGDHASATKALDDFHEVFGDDFYIELQPLNNAEQCEANFFLIKYALKNNVKMIATNDVHYALKEDYEDHAIMVDMGWGKTVSSVGGDRESVYTHDFWLRSYDEMIETFENQYSMMFNEESKYNVDSYISNHHNFMNIIREALENTNRIADQVESIILGSPIPLFPKTKIPEGFTDNTYLAALCIDSLFEYKKENPQIDIQKYFKRLLKELRVIKKKGFSPYFLTVYNYVNYCKQNKIPVGPGRGSASGSLCLYMLKITSNIDPIKYDLSFERFLTEDRTSPPDCICIYTQSNLMETLGVKCH